LRYQQVSREARELLATEGESGRFEFKQTARSVKPEVLCAAANWVALQRGEVEAVTLLVGVGEVKDLNTGLVKGEILGITDLETAIQTIQNSIRETRPVPVEVTIIEEGVATSKPFLRIKIRPTFSPHFDAEGRRQTRNNASTRPLTDEELLDLYLDREAAKFQQRFQQTADRLESALGDIDWAIDRVTSDLGDIDSNIDRLSQDFGQLHSAAWSAAQEAEESKSLAEQLQSDITDLTRYVIGQGDDTPAGLYFRVMDTRWRVWDAFCLDAAYRPTKTTDQLATRLKDLLEQPVPPDNWLANMNEIGSWNHVLKRRGEKWTMTAWFREIKQRENATPGLEHPIMQDDLIDDLRAERDRALAVKPTKKHAKPRNKS
jgi:hypothetical protein